MQTDKDKKHVSSQVMELKDLISGPLVATIDADSISSRRYLNYLLDLTFESYDRKTGKAGKMRTLDFTYQTQDVGGPHTQRISIPLLTLVPLPLLQVKEADFDFDIQIVDALSADNDAAFSLKNGSSPEEEESTEGVKLRVSMAQASREGKTTEGVRKSLTANMKVKVRMQQADMPGGLSNLLHLTTSNVQSESVDETEGKEVNDGQ
ncbi:MAG: DUF2589 domain-containing protein [Prevotella sp.]